MADLPSPATVAVVGAAGTIAPAIVRDLAESDEVSRMLLLDLDGARAAAFALDVIGRLENSAELED